MQKLAFHGYIATAMEGEQVCMCITVRNGEKASVDLDTFKQHITELVARQVVATTLAQLLLDTDALLHTLLVSAWHCVPSQVELLATPTQRKYEHLCIKIT